jgi:hypothetical protein
MLIPGCKGEGKVKVLSRKGGRGGGHTLRL